MNGRILTILFAFARMPARLCRWTVLGLRPVRFIRDATRKGLNQSEIRFQCFMIDYTWLILSFLLGVALLAMALLWFARSGEFDIMSAGSVTVTLTNAAVILLTCAFCLVAPYILVFLVVREPFMLVQRFLERDNLFLINDFLGWLAQHPECPIVLVLRPFERAFDARLNHVTRWDGSSFLGVGVPAALAVTSHVCSLSNPEGVVVLTAGYLDAPAPHLFEPAFIVSAWNETDWRDGISRLVRQSRHVFFIIDELTDGIIYELQVVEAAGIPCCVFVSDEMVTPLVRAFPRIGEWSRLAIFDSEEPIIIDPTWLKSGRTFDKAMRIERCTRVAVNDARQIDIDREPWTISQREMTRYYLDAHGLGRHFVDADPTDDDRA